MSTHERLGTIVLAGSDMAGVSWVRENWRGQFGIQRGHDEHGTDWHYKRWRLRKKSIGPARRGIALHLSSLRRTSTYAAFLKTCPPPAASRALSRLWPESFLLCRLPWRFLTKSSSIISRRARSTEPGLRPSPHNLHSFCRENTLSAVSLLATTASN